MTRAASTLRLAVSLICSVAFGASAAPSGLDPGWGDGGIVEGHSGPLLLQQDGRLVARNPRGFVRLHLNGQADPAFAGGGLVPASATYVAAAQHSDGRFDILHSAVSTQTPHRTECRTVWSRHGHDGMAFVSFGDQGLLALPWLSCFSELQIDSASRATMLGRSRDDFGFSDCIFRFDAEGRELPRGECFDGTLSGSLRVHFLRLDAADRLLAGLRVSSGVDTGFALKRYASGAIDVGFGTGGLAFVPLEGTPELDDAIALADERIVLAGTTTVSGARQVIVVRLTAQGVPDATFGIAGLAVVPFAQVGDTDVDGARIAVQGDGRVVVAATVTMRLSAMRSFSRVGVARLTRDGALDASFAGAGLTSVWSKAGSQLQQLQIRASGEILLAVTPLAPDGAAGFGEILQLRGGDLPAAHPERERRAVEYSHPGSGHYFVTASEVEIALLDSSPDRAWTRTGRAFNVYGEGPAPLLPVCRFWSDQSFAPKSSHFYTPYAHECELLKQGTVWRYEGTVFHLRLPEGVPDTKTCPADSQPLYRAYNNNLSGAPNHRYMTDPALLDQMIAQGWTMEGEAATRVFACVPLQE